MTGDHAHVCHDDDHAAMKATAETFAATTDFVGDNAIGRWANCKICHSTLLLRHTGLAGRKRVPHGGQPDHSVHQR